MEKEFKNYSVFTARIIVGLIFITASIFKIYDPFSFIEIIKNYQILPTYMINDTAIILPFIELITGLFLLSGIFVKGSSIISSLLIFIFLAALIFNLSRGIDVSCGCFSSVNEEITKLSSFYYVMRDLIFLILSISVLKHSFTKS